MTAEVAVRIAGLVLALPFLLGLLPGSLAAVAIGVAALGAARALASPAERVFPAAAVVVFVAAVAVGAARWESLDLDFVRGAQAVLGPTVAVEPPQGAGAAAAAAVAGVAAFGLWLGKLEPLELWWAEAVTGALVLVTVFSGPALSGFGTPESFLRAVVWLLLVAAVTGIGVVVARWAGRREQKARWRLLGAAAVLTTASALVLAGAP